jgi:hypothetical protein
MRDGQWEMGRWVNEACALSGPTAQQVGLFQAERIFNMTCMRITEAGRTQRGYQGRKRKAAGREGQIVRSLNVENGHGDKGALGQERAAG